jgi:hypothetical protein
MESKRIALPDGSAWAAILAAAIGCFGFGILVDLSEGSKTCKRLLSFYKPSGDLSGKSTIAVVIWLIVWAILHVKWKRKNLTSALTIAIVSSVLILLALVMTFPAFFGMFG